MRLLTHELADISDEELHKMLYPDNTVYKAITPQENVLVSSYDDEYDEYNPYYYDAYCGDISDYYSDGLLHDAFEDDPEAMWGILD